MSIERLGRRTVLSILAVAAVAAVAPSARAESVRELVERADRVLRGKTSAAVLRMDIQTKSYKRSYKMVLWDDSSHKDEKTLVRILGPTSYRGYSTLKVGAQLKLYDPKTNHIQTVGSSMLGDSWMGSHFSNDDLVKETQLARHYEPKLVGTAKGKNEAGDGVKISKIELTPKPTAPVVWGKILFVIWQRGDAVVPLRSEYFKKAGDKKPVRIMRFSKVKEIEGRQVPTVLEVTVAKKPGESTRLTYEKLRFDAKIPGSKFTEQAMR